MLLHPGVALVAILMGLNLLEVVQLRLPAVDLDVRQLGLPPLLQVWQSAHMLFCGLRLYLMGPVRPSLNSLPLALPLSCCMAVILNRGSQQWMPCGEVWPCADVGLSPAGLPCRTYLCTGSFAVQLPSPCHSAGVCFHYW